MKKTGAASTTAAPADRGFAQSRRVGAFDVALSFKLASLSTPCRSIA